MCWAVSYFVYWPDTRRAEFPFVISANVANEKVFIEMTTILQSYQQISVAKRRILSLCEQQRKLGNGKKLKNPSALISNKGYMKLFYGQQFVLLYAR